MECGGAGVVFVSGLKLSGVEEAVAHAIVSVGIGDALLARLEIDVSAELGEGVVVALLFEEAVAQIVVCEGVSLGRAVGGVAEVGTVIGCGVVEIVLAIVGLAAPVVRLTVGVGVVDPGGDGLVKAANGLRRAARGEGLDAHTEEDVLLGGKDFPTRSADFVDRGECGVVVLGGEVDLREVVADLVGILGVGEAIEEVLEDGDRLAEA